MENFENGIKWVMNAGMVDDFLDPFFLHKWGHCVMVFSGQAPRQVIFVDVFSRGISLGNPLAGGVQIGDVFFTRPLKGR